MLIALNPSSAQSFSHFDLFCNPLRFGIGRRRQQWPAELGDHQHELAGGEGWQQPGSGPPEGPGANAGGFGGIGANSDANAGGFGVGGAANTDANAGGGGGANSNAFDGFGGTGFYGRQL